MLTGKKAVIQGKNKQTENRGKRKEKPEDLMGRQNKFGL